LAIHGDLTGNDHGAGIIFLLQLGYAHSELLGDSALNRFNGDLAYLGIDELLEAQLGGRQSKLGAIEAAPG